MKLVSFLTRFSVVATASFALGILTGYYSLAAFAATMSTLLLLIAAHDYAPRSRRWQPRLAPDNRHSPHSRPAHRFRLAA